MSSWRMLWYCARRLSVGSGLQHQRTAGLRAELPPEEEAEHQPVPRRHWLDRLRKALLQARRSRRGDGEHRAAPGRAESRRSAYPPVPFELGKRGKCPKLSLQKFPDIPDRLPQRVAGHRPDAQHSEHRGLRLALPRHLTLLSTRYISTRYKRRMPNWSLQYGDEPMIGPGELLVRLILEAADGQKHGAGTQSLRGSARRGVRAVPQRSGRRSPRPVPDGGPHQHRYR